MGLPIYLFDWEWGGEVLRFSRLATRQELRQAKRRPRFEAIPGLELVVRDAARKLIMDVQTVVVILVVAVCAAFVVKNLLGKAGVGKAPDCGCGHCADKDEPRGR